VGLAIGLPLLLVAILVIAGVIIFLHIRSMSHTVLHTYNSVGMYRISGSGRMYGHFLLSGSGSRQSRNQIIRLDNFTAESIHMDSLWSV